MPAFFLRKHKFDSARFWTFSFDMVRCLMIYQSAKNNMYSGLFDFNFLPAQFKDEICQIKEFVMSKTFVPSPVKGLFSMLMVFLVLGFVISGCSLVKSVTTSKSEAKQLFKAREQYVRIVKQDAAKGVKVPPNEHPVSLDEDQLRNALSTLEITMPGNSKSTPVFTKPELDTLGKYLSQGLAQATPEEDVAFVLIGDYRAAYGLAKEPKYTSARVFYRDGKLQLIFGKIQEDYKQYVDRRLYPLAPGSRAVPSPHTWTLLGQPDQDFYMSSGGQRTDWIVLDLASMEARAVMGEKASANQAPSASGAQPFSVGHKSVEERLQILNELKTKKLITEEEYQQKRLDILKDL